MGRKNTVPPPESESKFCLKYPDGTPFLRHDIQYDLLEYIFSDRIIDFTAPIERNAPEAPPVRLHFDQLYLEAILSSEKLSATLKTALISNPTYALHFCYLALLLNVGRLNTTHTFSETSSAKKPYNSVPSLQSENYAKENLISCERMKTIVKACRLDYEGTTPPEDLKTIATSNTRPRVRGPPTSVVSAITNLFGSEIRWVSAKYFPPGFTAYDLFYPSSLSVESRGQAFLTLVHHVLENKTFINDFSNRAPYSPCFINLIPGDGTPIDVDTPDELKYAALMQQARANFVAKSTGVAVVAQTPSTAVVQNDAEAALIESPTKRQKTQPTDVAVSSHARTVADNDHLGDMLPVGRKQEDFFRTTINTKSTLPQTWSIIKRDYSASRDPDYDSENESWPLDLLLQRSLLTIVDPATGKHRPIKEIQRMRHASTVEDAKQQYHIPEEARELGNASDVQQEEEE